MPVPGRVDFAKCMTNQSDYLHAFSARDRWARTGLSIYALRPEIFDPPYQDLRLRFVRLGSALQPTASSLAGNLKFDERYSTQQSSFLIGPLCADLHNTL